MVATAISEVGAAAAVFAGKTAKAEVIKKVKTKIFVVIKITSIFPSCF